MHILINDLNLFDFDRFDNAQRIEEKGFGVRLEPYSFKEEELIKALDRLLNDTELQRRLKEAVKRMANSESKVKVCQRIENVVRKFKEQNQ